MQTGFIPATPHSVVFEVETGAIEMAFIPVGPDRDMRSQMEIFSTERP